MTSEDIDFKAAAILSTRTLYFIANWNAIIHLCSYDGSFFFPTAEYGRADSFFYFLIFGLVSVFSMIFTIRNCKNIKIEIAVIVASVLFGIWASTPA